MEQSPSLCECVCVCVSSPLCSIISLWTSSSTATPMLSLVITLFSMASEPSELAMASWLNSTVCFWTRLNLEGGQKDMSMEGEEQIQ